MRPFRFRLSVFLNGINAKEPELMTWAEMTPYATPLFLMKPE